MDAPLRREVFSPSLVRMWAGLLVPQLRFLLTSWLAGAWLAALAAALVAGWRALARPSSMLALHPGPQKHCGARLSRVIEEADAGSYRGAGSP